MGGDTGRPDGSFTVNAGGSAGAPVGRLLLVDDEEPLVELLTLALDDLGYRVSGFVDSEAALAAFVGAPDEYDALVSDLSMPRLSGLDLAARVVKERPGLPVVLTSGWVRPEDEAAGAALGIRGLVAKGSSVDEIVRGIDRALREGAPGGAPRAGSG